MSAGVSRDKKADTDEPWFCLKSIERSARLWSGMILLVFVTSHLLNHALGVFGLAVMEQVQEWRIAVWRSWPGTLVLFGAFATHVALSLRRVVVRRTWRMPLLEAFQILLGILIPFLLIGHVVGTRVLSSLVSIDDSYANILRYLWPANALLQSLALLVVWGHGAIGFYYAFHVRSWFKRLKTPLAIVAAVVPLLALAGFVAAGREAAKLATPPEAWTSEQLAAQAAALSTGRMALLGVLGLVVSWIVFKLIRARLSARLSIRYVGHGAAEATPGLTLLEISRANHIPHPSACGGRGRCSSCRVLIVEGQQSLDPPSGLEQRMLDRIRAPLNVRLACQVRPRSDLHVRVLLGVQPMSTEAGGFGGTPDFGVEEELTVLFADIRGFATLAKNQLPSDFIVLLNRVIGEMTQAIEAREGRVANVQTDGVMAIFGMGGKSRAGSRAALHAAADILKAVHLVNKDIRAALPLPIRVGIGIHSGEVVVSRTDDGGFGQRSVVVGDAVVIASRLEEATKELAADCVISSHTLATAGLSPPPTAERTVHYKNGASPVKVHAFGDRQDLRVLLGRKADQPQPHEAAPASA